MGLDKAKGVLIAGLFDKGPAQQAGLQPGDVLLDIDGRPITDARRLERMVADEAIDQQVKFKVWRKRQEKIIEVKIGQLDETEVPKTQLASIAKPDQKTPPPAQVKALGLALAEATPELREKYQLGDSATVVITDVSKGSPAGDRDLKPGDVVVEIAQQEAKKSRGPPEADRRGQEGRRKSVLLLVDRGGDLRFVALRIDQG